MAVEKIITAEVAVCLPIYQTLTYLVDSDHDLTIGSRVLVPLSNRKVTGFVVELNGKVETDYKLRKISSVSDKYPLFNESLLPFFKWISEYYHYPLGLVLKAAVPGGLNSKTVVVLRRGEKWDDIQSISSELNLEIPLQLFELNDKSQLSSGVTRHLLKSHKKLITTLEIQNCVVIHEQVTEDKVREKVERCYALNSDRLNLDYFKPSTSPEKYEFEEFRKTVAKQLNTKFLLSEAKTLYYHQYLSGNSGYPTVPRKDILQSYSGSSKGLELLTDKGILSHIERRVYRNPFGDELPFYPENETLTEQQTYVLGKINRAICEKQFNPFLLFGVTGSGKTEVYLRAAETTLKEGRDVIVLVPEIALATQLEAHFVSRFGDMVVLQHSGLSTAEKYDQYHLALFGKAKIVIGARSAIFAPLKDPGLIIVDEEHDSGFKQDDSFRYQGRDIAVVRAKHHGATVILGSATPSVTSYTNAKEGKYQLLVMDKRVGERALPDVQIVDLGLGKNGKIGADIFSNKLKEQLQVTFNKRKQSLLLLNRRGFSSIVICKDCGEIVQCKHCNVSLTLHKKSKKLVCHYCGFFLADTILCRSCGSDNIVPVGFGTERIEEEIQKIVPEARVARLDSDTAGDRKKFLAILSEMRAGNIDILVGTQMIAKGHHFPNVILVGVILADGGMNLPDYRAAEKTFQLISQVTGRAGRGDHPGRVIIQTLRPEHYAIQFAKDHDYVSFYDREMEIRSNPAFPPHVRVIVFHVQGENEKDVQLSCSNIGRYIRQVNRDDKCGLSVLGPAPSAIDKIKNRYRWQVLIKGATIDMLHRVCHKVEDKKSELLVKKSNMIIDVDPDNLM